MPVSPSRHLPYSEATWGWTLELWPRKIKNTESNLLNTLKNVDTNTLKTFNQKPRMFLKEHERNKSRLILMKTIIPLNSSSVLDGLKVINS